MAEQSIAISFISEVTEADQALVIDLYDEKNEDETQFLYGEKAYFRIFKYPSDLNVTITKSDGVVTAEGSGECEEEEIITFVNADESSVSKPVKDITSYEWLGESLGAVSAVGTTIKVSQTGVAVLKLKYTSDFNYHAISVGVKSEEQYPVVVFVEGE